MEGVVVNATAYDRNCLGCKRFGREIMVSMQTELDGKIDFNDFFLTEEQAQFLIRRLHESLKSNLVD